MTDRPSIHEILDDLPDDELIQYGKDAERELDRAKDVYAQTQAAILRRMHARQARAIFSDNDIATEEQAYKRHDWNRDILEARVKPVVPAAVWESIVAEGPPVPTFTVNTRKANRLIDDLGPQDPVAIALSEARTITATPKVVFKEA